MRTDRLIIMLWLLVALALGVGPLWADELAAPVPVPVPADADDMSPGLGLFALGVMIVVLLLIGLGAAIGLALCAVAGALAALGILSTAMTVGYLRRSPASGVRALVLQLGAAAGAVSGIGAAWLAAWLIDAPWSVTTRIAVGGAAGLACGLALGWLFNFAWGRIAAWLLLEYDRRQSPEPKVPVSDAG